MQLRRADRLSSPSTTHQGDCLVSVAANMSSLAWEYSSQRARDSMSIGDSFHRFSGLSTRSRNRRSCSSSLTENQYLMSEIPDRSSMFSNCGQDRRNSSTSSSVAKPMTRSTPARLYQERSNRTISPAAGSCST